MNSRAGGMRAWRLHEFGDITPDGEPLRRDEVPIPRPAQGELLLKIHCCGICHTEIDEIEARAAPPDLPVIPGHQVVGTVQASGPETDHAHLGRRVGVAWIHSACGHCRACREGRENLCPNFRGCGKDVNGGYADYMLAPAAFVHPLPDTLDDALAAPLLCAGAVGWRALNLCELANGEPLGFTGFGASGHLVLQLAKHRFPDTPLFVFARNPDERALALRLGADWAGDTTDTPPEAPAAIIDTTPAWKPVLAALAALRPGGRLVINAIAKEAGDLDVWQGLDYPAHLWREKQLRTVTNVTREDVRACLAAAAAAGVRPEVTRWAFDEANDALRALRFGGRTGAHVLMVETPPGG